VGQMANLPLVISHLLRPRSPISHKGLENY